jgi:uncharacterized protein (DUF169 family)
MKVHNVNRVTKALGLERKIIGLRFVAFKQEYEAIDLPAIKNKVSFCFMARKAMQGEHFKLCADSFRCKYAAYALGIIAPDVSITSGRNFYASTLYEGHVIAREALNSMHYLDHQVYGAEIGPLEDMLEADIILIMGSAFQTMRIMQGYAYKYGEPKHMCSLGNQAMCSDLVSKPFYNNDINFSFLCKGARMYTQADEGEMGIGFPISMFDAITEGIIMTVNPVNHKVEKEAILKRLESPDELDIEIDIEADYGKSLEKYEAYVEKMNNQ